MYVKKISLKNYRNIEKLDLELKDGVNIFYGKNAQGKTNLLESVYIGATGRSHRTHKDKELIKFGQDEAHIRLEVQKETIFDKIDIHLKNDSKKGIAINNIPINKLGELFGYLNVVIFSPEDLSLIKQGPQERRKFIDMELCQINNIYYYNLSQYHKVLKQRNTLLKKIIKNISLKDTLFVWDSQLVDFGVKIIQTRDLFIKKLNYISNKIHKDITNSTEILELKYKPSVTIEEFKEKIDKNIDKDILYGTTCYGPHKDDLLFFINGVNARDFGSQGQQRTASLSTKLAEIKLIEEEKGILPVLLLDDVLSELDKDRQRFLIKNIKNLQVIITCTGVEDVLKNLDEKCNIFNVSNGKINTNNN
ncbi:DNA replication/repair protein RecF [uncultured Tyzzerella sp.]|uniref:DNA replication/repair protein RecF n=1 Tax=uncultured Tyzzerella sp. TaxID=2321398 RepID=UPI0029428B1B|nr:DNA replication/repair protein RecF [uncultured Tyzzerella sp.]